jgi:hypothetical protein
MTEGAPHSSVHVAVRLYGDAVELVAERCHIRAVLLTLRGIQLSFSTTI